MWASIDNRNAWSNYSTGSFTGYNKNKNNDLNWNTASENQSQQFEIERSAVAFAFSKTGEENAHGNSNTINNYAFTDVDVSLGINYYRLRQVDFNGDFECLKTIAIQNPSTGIAFEVYPVPFKDEINISIFSNTNAPVEIKVTDIFGRLVLRSKTNIQNICII